MTATINAVLDTKITAETKEANKDLLTFAVSIDFTLLFEAVSQRLNLGNTLTFETPTICEHEEHQDCFGIACQSVNFIDKAPVLEGVMNDIHVAFPSNVIKWDEQNNQHCLWTSVHWMYTAVNDHMKGYMMGEAWFREEKGWEIIFVEPREKH